LIDLAGNLTSKQKLLNSVLELIGNTALLKLNSLIEPGKGIIYAKTEFMNPSGSIKDRMVKHIIEQAEECGDLTPGSIIVEASSGNTGVALSMVASIKGYRACIVVPDTTSKVKTGMMKRYGAELIFTPSAEGVIAVISKALELVEEKNAFLLNQFINQDNVNAQKITGREILAQLNKIDVFCAGIGTGGTLSGIGSVLKEANPDVRLYAVEPELAPAFYNAYYKKNLPIHQGIPHKIEGIGESFVSQILMNHMELVDGVILCSDFNAMNTMAELTSKEGLCVGVSSGANVWAAKQIASDLEEHQNVVTILPDTGQRYLEDTYWDLK
jgi:cysteine synthase A